MSKTTINRSIFNHSLKYKMTFAGFVFGAIFIAGCNATPPGTVENTVGNSASNAITSTTTGTMLPFANSTTGLKGKLKENYVDFSFKYPESWEGQADSGGEKAQNFVKIERTLPDKSNGEITLENFVVGYFKHSNDAARNKVLLPKTVKQLSDQLAAKLPQYKKISEGPTKIGNYSGYEFRFQSVTKTPTKGNIPLWGRAVLLMEPKTTKGVALLMLASSLAPEIKGPADVGVKGQLPSILKTFKFGKE